MQPFHNSEGIVGEILDSAWYGVVTKKKNNKKLEREGEKRERLTRVAEKEREAVGEYNLLNCFCMPLHCTEGTFIRLLKDIFP